MKAKRRIQVTFETHETTVIRFGQNQKMFFCQSCQAETRHLSVAEAAFIAKVSEVTVFRLAEERLVHSIEVFNGKLMICADSI
jgi:hypothetical protein